MEDKLLITNQNFLQNHLVDKALFKLEVLETKESGSERLFINGTVFFFLQKGTASFSNQLLSIELSTGMYFSQKAPFSVKLGPNSKAIFVATESFECLNAIGGPIESIGRLKYINGCSDTLLLSPSRLGEPCLNLLHFPPHTIQTSHHHPSFRFGIVVSGSGESVTERGAQELNPGDCFFIPALAKHKFNTFEHPMNIIAFHPDSDWGPTDEVHPMKNRTIIT